MSQLFLNIDRNKRRFRGHCIYVPIYLNSVYTKKREIINYDRTIWTNRIKLIFQKFCQKRKVDLEKRLITPRLVVI